MRKIITAIFMFTAIIVSAQTNTTPEVAKNMFKINLLSPSLEYEVGVGKNATIVMGLGTALGAVSLPNDEVKFGLFASVKTAYRYYYNFEKRAKKGKNTAGNSANYISLTSSGIKSDKSIVGDVRTVDDYQIEIGPVWGFQRTYKSGFNLGLEMGLGYAILDKSSSYVKPIVNFRLGWAFGK